MNKGIESFIEALEPFRHTVTQVSILKFALTQIPRPWLRYQVLSEPFLPQLQKEE
jgi:hypothetical protein